MFLGDFSILCLKICPCKSQTKIRNVVFNEKTSSLNLFRVGKIYEKDKPHLIEIIMGYVSILIFAIQAVYKFYAGKGIFLLNPCHVVLVSFFTFTEY